MRRTNRRAAFVIGVASLIPLISNLQASILRLDFSLTLSSTYGLGNSHPGLVPGAQVTGSCVWNTDDFRFINSYPIYSGVVTVYNDPFGRMNFTATLGGTSYAYAGTSGDATIIVGDPGQPSHFQVTGGSTGGGLLLNKIVYPYSGDSSFNSFLTEMANGLNDGVADVTISDGNSINSVNGYLSSLTLTTIPEPSAMAIGLLGLFAFFTLRRSWFYSKRTSPGSNQLSAAVLCGLSP